MARGLVSERGWDELTDAAVVGHVAERVDLPVALEVAERLVAEQLMRSVVRQRLPRCRVLDAREVDGSRAAYAHRDGSTWRVFGSVVLGGPVSPGDHGLLVLPDRPERPTLAVVPLGCPSAMLLDAEGWPLISFRFDGLIPTRVSSLDASRVTSFVRRRTRLICAAVISCAQQAVHRAVDETTKHVQFGRSLDHFQAVRHHVARAALSLGAARAAEEQLTAGAGEADCAATAASVLNAIQEAMIAAGRVTAGRGAASLDPGVIGALQILHRSHGSIAGVTADDPVVGNIDAPARKLLTQVCAGQPGRGELADNWATVNVKHIAGRLSAASPVDDAATEFMAGEVLVETLPRGLAARVLTHRMVLTSYLAAAQGSHVQRHWRPVAVTGRALGAIAISEPHGGSDLRGLRTTIRSTGAGLVVEGTKSLCAGGADCDFAVVAGVFESRVALVVVDVRRPEVVRIPRHLPAWRGVGFAQLEFRSCPVPRDDVISLRGMELLLAGLVRERVALAVQQLASCRGWLADPSLSARIDLHERWRWVRALVREVCQSVVDGDIPLVGASMAKTAAADLAVEVATARASWPGLIRDVPVRGATVLEDPVHGLADARAGLLAAGTPEVNLNIIADDVLPPVTTHREGR